MTWLLLLKISILLVLLYCMVYAIISHYFTERSVSVITQKQLIKDKKLGGW